MNPTLGVVFFFGLLSVFFFSPLGFLGEAAAFFAAAFLGLGASPPSLGALGFLALFLAAALASPPNCIHTSAWRHKLCIKGCSYAAGKLLSKICAVRR